VRTTRALCLAAVAAAAAPCDARPDQETASFTSVASSGLLNAPANTVLQHTFNGGYPLGLATFSGTLTSMNSRTWRTDSRILVTAPGGASTTIQPFTTGTTFTSLPFSGSMILAPGIDPAGQWTFRFYEAFADAAPGQMDARWDITINLTNDPPPAPTATDLGAMLAPGRVVQNVTVQFGAVKWYRFTVPWAAHPGLSTYLDIDTVGSVFAASTGQAPNDTQLALYSATGDLLHFDDDTGPGFTSQFSFGAGTRPATGDGAPLDGRTGPLAPGTYYLAAAPYQVQFGATYWSVTPIDTRSGTLTLNFGTNITAAAPACYANCDSSTIAPVLNVQDFACFLNAFAAGSSYANCDQSTTSPILNVQDFACFLNRFAAGCP
jgi:hypothetical protein